MVKMEKCKYVNLFIIENSKNDYTTYSRVGMMTMTSGRFKSLVLKIINYISNPVVG